MTTPATTAALMTAEAFCEWTQQLTGADVLPGFRCRIADFFRLPGDKAASANEL